MVLQEGLVHPRPRQVAVDTLGTLREQVGDRLSWSDPVVDTGAALLAAGDDPGSEVASVDHLHQV
jgi:hypothetical protein